MATQPAGYRRIVATPFPGLATAVLWGVPIREDHFDLRRCAGGHGALDRRVLPVLLGRSQPLVFAPLAIIHKPKPIRQGATAITEMKK